MVIQFAQCVLVDQIKSFQMYILRGHMYKFTNNYVLRSINIVFILLNSAGLCEMPRFAPFPGSSMFAKVSVWGPAIRNNGFYAM